MCVLRRHKDTYVHTDIPRDIYAHTKIHMCTTIQRNRDIYVTGIDTLAHTEKYTHTHTHTHDFNKVSLPPGRSPGQRTVMPSSTLDFFTLVPYSTVGLNCFPISNSGETF